MEDGYVLCVIERIIQRKKEAGIKPYIALDREIYHEIIQDSNKQMNQLFRDKKIKVQKSVNDKIININEEKDE